MPKNLSIIGDSAFQWCIIDGVTIPKYIKEIGKYPFSKNAKNIISDSSRFIIENSLLIDIDNNELIQLVNSTIKQVSIPGRITKIRERAFIHTWKSHTNLTHPGKYFRPSKVKIMRPTSPK